MYLMWAPDQGVLPRAGAGWLSPVALTGLRGSCGSVIGVTMIRALTSQPEAGTHTTDQSEATNLQSGPCEWKLTNEELLKKWQAIVQTANPIKVLLGNGQSLCNVHCGQTSQFNNQVFSRNSKLLFVTNSWFSCSLVDPSCPWAKKKSENFLWKIRDRERRRGCMASCPAPPPTARWIQLAKSLSSL